LPEITRMKPRASAPTLEKLRKAAVEAALTAGAVLKKNFEKTIQVREKVDAGLVTEVDLAAEKAAMGVLEKAFPSFSFLAEESGATTKAGGNGGRWIIDPLDGTTNFVHSFPMFCVSIAAELEGQLAVGVIFHPILEDLYVGVRGVGATVNRRPLRVSKTARLQDSLLTTGFSYRKGETLRDEMGTFEKLTQMTRAIRRPGSAALDLAYLARGVFDGFWERTLSPWDVAAGMVIVEEAGGKLTNFAGEPFQLTDSTLLASNSALHPELLRVITENH
jgi:myo-inositol-1(or 4)-monophosphatase